MAAGVRYGNVTTKPCRIEKVDRYAFQIILTQGLNRQIRRMCQALGYRVMDLQRIRMVNILLGDIKPNQHRLLMGDEISGLLWATSSGNGSSARQRSSVGAAPGTGSGYQMGHCPAPG
ncbi:hypothetical protein [Endozoicomonas sp. SCSIO W0465]|uniref:hypothetical protein n=1 Tax=Endozoicomonas sp. SCSIO W0465 TaxID=2918516 RepID=UPI0020750012|nr:hypothetical protein [Endozoicomonas sp. SCSIO W0465]USE39080.1 hypothetical protein MJO57_13530 [Endozoicomonas sp. SCSIO W0465]